MELTPRDHGHDDRDHGGRGRRPAKARRVLRLRRLWTRLLRSAAHLLWTAGLRLRSPLWPPLLSILSLLGCNAGLATDHANDDKILRDPRPGQVNQGFRGRWQGENRRRFQSSIAECRTEHPVRAMQPDAKRARNTAVPTSIDVQNQREPPSFALEKILSKTCMD